MSLVNALEETWVAIGEILDDPSAWDTPTPCVGWSVGDIAAHLGHIEGMINGFDQPDPPTSFDPDAWDGLSRFTEAGVAARRLWERTRVVDELSRASELSLEAARRRSVEDWQQPTWSPVGTVPATVASEIRLADAYAHLLDLRMAVGHELNEGAEPTAVAAVVERALRLTPWGAVKRAGLGDGTHIRLDISGPGGTTSDLVVVEGRGSLVEATEDSAPDGVTGSGLAYFLAVGGRDADAAGGLTVHGHDANRLIVGYRIFV